jgi:glycerol uptake facilitator-like aquaporin
MFDLPLLQVSAHLRTGPGQWLGELTASAGLVLVILRAPPGTAAARVAAYIGAAYWFTSSTSFANPAAVLGRMFTDSFAGIAPASAPGHVLAELAGAALGLGLEKILFADARACRELPAPMQNNAPPEPARGRDGC